MHMANLITPDLMDILQLLGFLKEKNDIDNGNPIVSIYHLNKTKE